MAIFSATNLSPNNFSLISSTPNIFSWDFNGSDTQTDYQIFIYDNDTNTLVYYSTKITSSNEYHTVSSGTLTNNKTYKWQVQTFINSNSAKSSWFIFKTNSAPTLTMGSLPTSKQTYTFSTTYSHAENIPIRTYRYQLFLASTPLSSIADSGEIYPDSLIINSSTSLEYTFDGMLSGETYLVECTCVNQNSQTATTGQQSFSVTYNYPPNIPNIIITPNNNLGIMTVDWTNLIQVLPVVTGTYSYVTGKFGYGLQLDEGSYITYNGETYPEDYTLYFWIKLPVNFNGDIMKLTLNSNSNNIMRVFLDNNRFGFQLGDLITCGGDTSGNLNGHFIKIGLKYSELIVQDTNTNYLEILTV